VTRLVHHLVKPVTQILPSVLPSPVTSIVRHLIKPVTKILKVLPSPVTSIVNHLGHTVHHLLHHLLPTPSGLPLPPPLGQLPGGL